MNSRETRITSARSGEALLERVFAWLARPLSQASNRQQFANHGYSLLVPLAGLVALSPWWWAPLDPRVREIADIVPDWVRLALQVVLEGIPLPHEVEYRLPLLQLVAIIYLLLGFSNKWRQRLGRLVANSIIATLGTLIAWAEWSMERRWQSALLITLLAMSLALSIVARSRMVTDETLERISFDRGLSSIETLLSATPFDGSEQYNGAEIGDLAGATFLSEEDRQVAAALERSLSLLYAPRKPKSPWLQHLQAIRPLLLQQHEVADSYRGLEPRPASPRLWDALHLMLAKVHLRLARDDCSRVDYALQSLTFLGEISPDGRSLAANTLGNVYGCLALVLLLDAQGAIAPASTPATVYDTCPHWSDCIQRALHYYDESAAGEEPCSFADRRRINNTLDLKLKLARSLETIGLGQLTTPTALPSWLRSGSELAGELLRDTHQLLDCNRVEPVVPLVFVTAAQASAAMATLRPADSFERGRSLRAAGSYLRLAYSYRPSDLGDWDLSDFCVALSPGQGLSQAFVMGVASLEGLPDLSRGPLERILRAQCKSSP
jgi:hypothetical protein